MKLLFKILFLLTCFNYAYAQNAIKNPKPITLTFFELTNKLTAKHKVQLDKVAKLLKKDMDMHLLIIGGASWNKPRHISYKRINNIINFIQKRNIHDSILHENDNGDIDNHNVKLVFYKNIIDSSKLINFDSTSYFELDFKQFGCWLSKQNHAEFSNLAHFLNKHNLKIKIECGVNESMDAHKKADCRKYRIKNFLKEFCNVNLAENDFNKNNDMDDFLVSFTIKYPE